MDTLEVTIIPALSDNYVFLLQDRRAGFVAVIDPATAEVVTRELESRGLTLDLILNTHHHEDHTGGNRELKAKFGCRVVGPQGDKDRIPAIDLGVRAGEQVEVGQFKLEVIETPGHTRAHVAFHCPAARALFCGDTLFSLGCGRLLEGTADQMWTSLQKLRDLPDDTLVYFGHEYTEANAAFALSVDPGNPALLSRAEAVRVGRQAAQPSTPTLLGEEKRANPFLRADHPVIAAAMGLNGRPAVDVFAALRQAKNTF